MNRLAKLYRVIAVVGSEMAQVNGNLYENKGPVVMDMASESVMFLEPIVFAELLLQ